MSDTEQSGASGAAQSEPAPTPAPSAAPAVSQTDAPAQPTESPTPNPGAFGSTRGSGLARGKRSNTTAPVPTAHGSDYRPTSIEVVKNETSFVNPFAPAEPAAPAAPAPVAEVIPEAAPAPVVHAEPVPAPKAEAPKAETSPASTPPTHPAVPSEDQATLNILPPAETNRPSQSWENRPVSSEREGGEVRPRRDDRRDARRDDRRDDRGVRRDQPRLEQRAPLPREEATPAPAPVAKKGGFFAWLKGLFGKPKETATPQSEQRKENEFSTNRRHRQRGGHGRNEGERRGSPGFGQQGQQSQQGNREGREGREGGYGYDNRGQGGQGVEGGQRRRRRRGGRGRHQGGGDYRGGDTRPPQA